MNQIQIFSNPAFGDVRTVEENGKVLFCGSDIAKALGYVNPRDAIKRHCRGVVKRDGVSTTTNQHGVSTEQYSEMSFVPEGDVYRLIVSSKLPAAEQFERWVFDEVLPTVRKHGMYATDELLNNPDVAIAAFTALKQERAERQRLEAKVNHDAPMVLFAKSVSVSEQDILIGELAKILKGNGVDIGQNRLFERLRQDGYLIRRKGTDYNMPTQRSMELGLFKIKETVITHSDGHVSVSKTTKVTGCGQVYFVNLYLGKKNLESVS